MKVTVEFVDPADAWLGALDGQQDSTHREPVECAVDEGECDGEPAVALAASGAFGGGIPTVCIDAFGFHAGKSANFRRAVQAGPRAIRSR